MLEAATALGDIAAREREMLVRYCTRFTGDPIAAEDLAQQALLEAWQKADRLYNREVQASWLIGIARNVCLRWSRSRGVATSRLVCLADTARGAGEEAVDLEVELDRDELARLLHRALALLPAETHDILIQRYVEESPQAEVAARLGLTEGAVEARLQRGKLALRRILTTQLSGEAASYGLISASDAGWQETRIWCPDCGERRLVGRFGEGGDLQLDCVGCQGTPRAVQVRSRAGELVWEITSAALFQGITGYKAALNRVMARSHAFYNGGIAGRTARCGRCGQPAALRVGASAQRGYHDVQTDCTHCGQVCGVATTSAVALGTPQGRAFWHKHVRIRTLPGRAVEAAGVPATVACFASITGAARLEIVLAQNTLEVLGVDGVATA